MANRPDSIGSALPIAERYHIFFGHGHSKFGGVRESLSFPLLNLRPAGYGVFDGDRHLGRPVALVEKQHQRLSTVGARQRE